MKIKYIIYQTCLLIIILATTMCDTENNAIETATPTPTFYPIEAEDVPGTVHIDYDGILRMAYDSGAMKGPIYDLEIIGDLNIVLRNYQFYWINAKGTFYCTVERDEYIYFDGMTVSICGSIFEPNEYEIINQCHNVMLYKEDDSYYLTHEGILYLIEYNGIALYMKNELMSVFENIISYNTSPCICGEYNYVESGQSTVLLGDYYLPGCTSSDFLYNCEAE